MECFRLLLEHLAWIEHQWHLSGIRDSRKAWSLWGMMRGVGGVRKSIHQSWLAKVLWLLCWGFKGVQEEIPSEEASTLQIGSAAFPLGQCTSRFFNHIFISKLSLFCFSFLLSWYIYEGLNIYSMNIGQDNLIAYWPRPSCQNRKCTCVNNRYIMSKVSRG